MGGWKEYFQDILRKNTTLEILKQTNIYHNSVLISEKELNHVIKELWLAKPYGHDGIYPDIIKYLELEGKNYLLERKFLRIGLHNKSNKYCNFLVVVIGTCLCMFK